MEFEAGTATVSATVSAPAKLQQTVQTYSPDASTILEKLFITAKQDGTTSPESEYVPLRKRSFPTSFWNFMAETGPTGLAHPRPRAAYTVKKGKLFAEQAPAAAVAAAAAAAAASPAATSQKATVMETQASTGAESRASISKPASLLERTPTRPEKPSRKSSVSGKFEKEKKRPKTPAKALADGGASKADKRRKSAPGGGNRKSKISQMGKRLLASTTSIKGEGDTRRSPIGSLRPSRFIDIRGLSPTSSEDSRISSQTDCSLADCVSPFVTPTPDAIQNQQRSLSCPPITGSYGMDAPMQMVGLVDDFSLEQEFNVVQRGDGARSMFELGGQDAIHLLGHMDTSVDLFDDGPDSPGATSPGLLFSDHRKPNVMFAPEARPLGTFTTIKMEHIR